MDRSRAAGAAKSGGAVAILDHLSVLADATRSRMLLILDGHELTVRELCGIVQLPQSTVSRHLKALADAGWVAGRAEGTSRLYSMARSELNGATRRLWTVVREQISATPAATQDQRRLSAALSRRRSTSQQFFASSGGRWDRLRDELFGSRFHLAALAALADPDSIAGDLGCGTGQVSAALSPFVARIIGVDGSATMLRAARKRLAGIPNIELRRGELEALPIEDATLDLATLMLVLHHVAEPVKALGEAARVLRPGGRVLIVDMLPHDREQYRRTMGHVWLGFSEEAIQGMIRESGLSDGRLRALPPDASAKGPALFVATARRH